jgi:hypothetical protein
MRIAKPTKKSKKSMKKNWRQFRPIRSNNVPSSLSRRFSHVPR